MKEEAPGVDMRRTTLLGLLLLFNSLGPAGFADESLSITLPSPYSTLGLTVAPSCEADGPVSLLSCSFAMSVARKLPGCDENPCRIMTVLYEMSLFTDAATGQVVRGASVNINTQVENTEAPPPAELVRLTDVQLYEHATRYMENIVAELTIPETTVYPFLPRSELVKERSGSSTLESDKRHDKPASSEESTAPRTETTTERRGTSSAAVLAIDHLLQIELPKIELVEDREGEGSSSRVARYAGQSWRLTKPDEAVELGTTATPKVEERHEGEGEGGSRRGFNAQAPKGGEKAGAAGEGTQATQ